MTIKQRTLLLLAFLYTFCATAQLQLGQKDLDNLIAIAELCSKNTLKEGEDFEGTINKLRTSQLNTLANTLIASRKADMKMLEPDFLKRPDNDELILWYVIREIHYNNVSKTKKPRPAAVVASDVLSKKIDERWLLDNYYYRILGGVAKLFNEADLSQHDIRIDNLGFRNETEKGIFYFNMMNQLAGSRFKVLLMLKKPDAIIGYANRLPTFNGKDYYCYRAFDFEDFDWIGYEETESYKQRNMGSLYGVLIAQYSSLMQKDKKKAQEIYSNSILHEPKYFPYSGAKAELEVLYGKSK